MSNEAVVDGAVVDSEMNGEGDDEGNRLGLSRNSVSVDIISVF